MALVIGMTDPVLRLFLQEALLGLLPTLEDLTVDTPNPDLLRMLPHQVSSRAPTLRLSLTTVGVSPLALPPLLPLLPSLHLSLLLPSLLLLVAVAAVVVDETYLTVSAITTLALTLHPAPPLHLHLHPFQAHTVKLLRLSVKD